ncbi:MAG: hypothetical protein R2865_00555 [Deinococcales bacterium]
MGFNDYGEFASCMYAKFTFRRDNMILRKNPSPLKTQVAGNLLANASFEQFSYDQNNNVDLNDWIEGCTNAANISIQTAPNIHDGTYSIAMNGDLQDTCVTQNVDPSSMVGQTYTLNCWINFGWATQAYGALEVAFGTGGTVIHTDNIAFPTPPQNGQPLWQQAILTRTAPTTLAGWVDVRVYSNDFRYVDECSLVVGTTHYVDASNTTSPWNGTLNDPWKTISQAVDAVNGSGQRIVKPGDRVIVKSGTYKERVIIPSSFSNPTNNSNGQYITFGSEITQGAIIDGDGTNCNNCTIT